MVTHNIDHDEDEDDTEDDDTATNVEPPPAAGNGAAAAINGLRPHTASSSHHQPDVYVIPEYRGLASTPHPPVAPHPPPQILVLPYVPPQYVQAAPVTQAGPPPPPPPPPPPRYQHPPGGSTANEPPPEYTTYTPILNAVHAGCQCDPESYGLIYPQSRRTCYHPYHQTATTSSCGGVAGYRNRGYATGGGDHDDSIDDLDDFDITDIGTSANGDYHHRGTNLVGSGVPAVDARLTENLVVRKWVLVALVLAVLVSLSFLVGIGIQHFHLLNRLAAATNEEVDRRNNETAPFAHREHQQQHVPKAMPRGLL